MLTLAYELCVITRMKIKISLLRGFMCFILLLICKKQRSYPKDPLRVFGSSSLIFEHITYNFTCHHDISFHIYSPERISLCRMQSKNRTRPIRKREISRCRDFLVGQTLS